MRTTVGSLLFGIVTLGACGPQQVTQNDAARGDAASTPDTAMVATDSGTPPADAAPATDSGPTCAVPPSDQQCSSEGCAFPALALPRCDGGGDSFAFYGDTFCGARATLYVFSAGWCVPCQHEAPAIAQLEMDYRARGVRVVTVYGQNPNFTAASASYCSQWRRTYGLETIMVYDPTQLSAQVLPGLAYPSNVIVDGAGHIVYRQYGTSSSGDPTQTLRDQLDALLQ